MASKCCALSLARSIYLSIYLSLSLSRSLARSLALPRARARSLSLAHVRAHTDSLTHLRPLSLSRARALSLLSLFLSHSLTLSLATAAATQRRKDRACEAKAEGPLEHDELQKLRQENEDLRAQLRLARSDRSSKVGRERLRSTTLDPGPAQEPELAEGFEVLGKRYKEVWATMAQGRSPKRARAEDGGDSGGKFFDDRDGDFQACEEPNTSGVAAPHPKHAYFTRSASAEIAARMDGMGI